MKIALVIEHFDPARGGRELSTAQLATGLARRGQEVTIFCRNCSDACEGVRVLPLKAAGWDRSTRLSSFARSVRGAAAEGQFDIVHATLPIPGANVYQPRGGLVTAQASAASRRRSGWRRLVAGLLQPLNPTRWKLRGYERRLVRDPAVMCLAVSEMVAREFMNYYARGERVRVVFNGVDVPDVPDEQRKAWREEIRRRVGVAPGSPMFLTVANNPALKGVPETLDAFAQWYHSPAGVPGSRLAIIGRKKVRRLRLQARKLRVGKEVVFAGPTDDIFAWYSAADACVLLSWYDACSRVVLEAARWAVPSVTTVYNGAAEVLSHGAGIVVSSPRDTAAVVKALTQLADPAQRAKRAAACRDIADELSMDRHVEGLLNAYREVTAEP